jgi:hypothetical protein
MCDDSSGQPRNWPHYEINVDFRGYDMLGTESGEAYSAFGR